MNKQSPETVSLALLVFFLLFLFFSIFPFLPILSSTYYNHHRLLQIAFLSVCSLIYGLLYPNKKSPALWVYITPFLFFGFISALLSDEWEDSAMYTLHWALLMLLLVLATSIDQAKSICVLLVGIILLHSCIVLLSLLNLVFALLIGDPVNPSMIYVGFENIRFFNQVQVFVLPALLISMTWNKIRLLSGVLLTINLLLGFVGSSRGLGVVWCLILIMLFVSGAGNRSLTIKGVIITLFSFVLFLVVRYVDQGIGALEIRTSSSGRLDMWYEILRSLEFSHMLYGVGPSLFEYKLNNTVFSHPHNSGIEILNEWGGGGLIVFVLFVFSTLVSALQHIKRYPADLATLTILFCWLSGGGYSLLSGVLVMPIPQTLFFLFWGVLIGRCSTTHAAMVFSSSKVRSSALFLMVILMSTYLFFVSESYLKLDDHTPSFKGPRFWVGGERNLGGDVLQ